MKKKVNGKTVEVSNIEVFEKAAEGLAIGRTATSSISDNIQFDSNLVNNIVESYNSFYTALPYPLYALDTDVKYAAIGQFIKASGFDKYFMWVDNGLYICIDESNNIAIYFVNSTWGVVKVDKVLDNNTVLDNYTNHCGYKDFSWALERAIAGQSLSVYYKEFMPEFIEACNSQPMVMKWELSNILNFGKIPNEINLPLNKIIDIENNTEYMLDIFVTGTRESKEKQFVFNLSSDETSLKPKRIKTYGFEVYEKVANGFRDNCENIDKADKMVISKLYGAYSLFSTLNLIRGIADRHYFEDFKAFIAERNLVYEIDKRIFISKAYKFVEPKEVAKGVEIYSFDRGIIYLVKRTTIGKGTRKEIFYSYSLRDANLRLCKIKFTHI